MDPTALGKKYDHIATWWQTQHDSSDYGLRQIEKALGFRPHGGTALDVGCGSSGRVFRLLERHGYAITGLDVSAEMIKLASASHPQSSFVHDDICRWTTQSHFDVILAWDSIFHLPLAQQRPVLDKLCRLLNDGGVLIYSFGDATGDHNDVWRGDTFYYSSIGINENLKLLVKNMLCVRHLELDQHPQKHVYVIAQKP